MFGVLTILCIPLLVFCAAGNRIEKEIIYDDGTGKEIITGPNANTNTFTWYDVGETFCYSGDCFKYEMAPDNKSFFVNVEEDSFCINEDYEVTGDNSERECLDSGTGNEWFPPKCNKTKYKKEI